MPTRENKAKQLREKTLSELEEYTLKLRRDLFDISFQHATRQLDDTASLKKTRRELARTLTVLGEKQKAEAARG